MAWQQTDREFLTGERTFRCDGCDVLFSVPNGAEISVFCVVFYSKSQSVNLTYCRACVNQWKKRRMCEHEPKHSSFVHWAFSGSICALPSKMVEAIILPRLKDRVERSEGSLEVSQNRLDEAKEELANAISLLEETN